MECSQEGYSNSANLQLYCLAHIKPAAHRGSNGLRGGHANTQTHNTYTYLNQSHTNTKKYTQWQGIGRNDRVKSICKYHNLSQISSLSNHISKAKPSKAVFNLCVCVCVCVLHSCHCASQWMSVKTVWPGYAKALFIPSPQPVYSFLPPRPKLLLPFGLPKPPLAGRLVEGQESASQGRPWSPAFSSPGRLRDKERRGEAVRRRAVDVV